MQYIAILGSLQILLIHPLSVDQSTMCGSIPTLWINPQYADQYTICFFLLRFYFLLSHSSDALVAPHRVDVLVALLELSCRVHPVGQKVRAGGSSW